MITYLYLLKLSLCPTASVCRAFVVLLFTGGQGVKPCKIFPGHSTILANGFELHCGIVPFRFS